MSINILWAPHQRRKAFHPSTKDLLEATEGAKYLCPENRERFQSWHTGWTSAPLASRCPILRLWGVWKLLLLDLGRVGVAREVESLDERFPTSPTQLDF